MRTPWGEVDFTKQIDTGFSFVATPSHGGYALTLKAAARLLSQAARDRGINQGGYLFFEEDCLYAIVDWETPQFWGSSYHYQKRFYEKGKTDEDIRASLLGTISAYNADYLIEIGVTQEDAEDQGLILPPEEEMKP